MRSLNQVNLIGHVGRKPELKYTPQGTPVAKFSVACNYSYTDNNGEKKSGVDWLNVVAWKGLAEASDKYIKKGSHVSIVGRLKTRTWKDKESGASRYAVDIVASDVLFLDTKGQKEVAPQQVEQTDEITDEDIPF
jgi:single-strand DNA-binding protein